VEAGGTAKQTHIIQLWWVQLERLEGLDGCQAANEGITIRFRSAGCMKSVSWTSSELSKGMHEQLQSTVASLRAARASGRRWRCTDRSQSSYNATEQIFLAASVWHFLPKQDALLFSQICTRTKHFSSCNLESFESASTVFSDTVSALSAWQHPYVSFHSLLVFPTFFILKS
jgi:hypothetical protein